MHIAKITRYSPCEFDKFAENTALRREKRLFFIYQIHVFYENRTIIPPARDIIAVLRDTLPQNRIVFPDIILIFESIFKKRGAFMINEISKSTFGSRVKALRKESGKTQVSLALALNTDASTISRWENDERQPDYGMLQKLAKILETSERYLMYGETDDTSDWVDLSGLNFEQKHTIRTLVRLLHGR